jgi:hypothetical protein
MAATTAWRGVAAWRGGGCYGVDTSIEMGFNPGWQLPFSPDNRDYESGIKVPGI